MKVILKKKDGNVLKLIDCTEICDKFELKTREINDDIKIRPNSSTDESAVLFQLLKKHNLENDQEAIRNVKHFLQNST